MPEIVQWGITTIVGILGLLGGRYWAKLEAKSGKDKSTMSKLNDVLPYATMKYIKEHDFGGSFPIDIVEHIEDFIEESKNPDFFFLNKKLNNLHVTLISETDAFMKLLVKSSFPLANPGQQRGRVPQPHEFDDPKDWRKLVDDIHDLADKAFNTYSALVRANKRLI